MENIKTISLLALLCALPLISSSSEKKDQFKPYTTDQFIYAISTTNRPMQADDTQLHEPIIISDLIKNNYFNSGITRTKISESTQDTIIIRTTETWKTANPSYFTWTNAALISGALGTTGLLNIAYTEYQQERMLPVDLSLHYDLQKNNWFFRPGITKEQADLLKQMAKEHHDSQVKISKLEAEFAEYKKEGWFSDANMAKLRAKREAEQKLKDDVDKLQILERLQYESLEVCLLMPDFVISQKDKDNIKFFNEKLLTRHDDLTESKAKN